MAGLSFAVLGAGTVLGGLLGPRVDRRRAAAAARSVGGFVVQAAATLAAGASWARPAAGWCSLLAATFVGGVANLVAIVGFMVTATAGLPDAEQGLATGLASMSQQVGITLGIPVMSAIATAAPADMLGGVSRAVAINALVCLAVAALSLSRVGRRGTR